MIELENLNDVSLDNILDEAKNQIRYINPEWTDFQESDPGITLVELFAWLKSVQHEYLNRILPGVERKFLKLLDITMRKNRGSETLLHVSDLSEDVTLPVRTPWRSGDMIFENVNHQTLISSKILSVSFENPEFPSETEYYRFDGNKTFYLFGKDIDRKNDDGALRRFTINFDSAIPKDSIFNLYFSVYSGDNLKRNPIKNVDKFARMADISWEYYGEENGVLGWHKLEIVKDNTYDFLFSGIVKIKIPGKIEPLNEEYKIRVTLDYDEYDYPPRINNIISNVFRACQNETKCENTTIKKSDISPNRTFKLFTHTAIYGRSYVYYKKKGGWVETDLATFKSDVKNGELIVDVSEAWDLITDIHNDEEAFMVVSCDQDFKDQLCLGSGTGTSAQYVEIDLQKILQNSFEIMISEIVDGEEIFYKWTSTDDLYSSDKYDRHYVMDYKRKILIFGDHEHGMAPRIGKNNIKLCSLRYTEGENSNTKEGIISKVISKNSTLKSARVDQIVPATGGEDRETLEHARARAADLFKKPGRAVTIKDYEEIVRKTPGLTFTNVKILPGYMEGEDVVKQNCVTVAVRWNKKIGLTLPPSFEKNIMNQINKYRLINTKVKVVSPAYVGISISGDITIDSSYREKDRLIEKEIKNFIDDINIELGQTLHFGDLFGMIDRLKYVSRLDKLRIIPIGNVGYKNISDDIVIPPNGVYYIHSINFNYVKSSEFYRD